MPVIENVGWQGWLCPLDSKPRKFSTCNNCTLDICDVPELRADSANRYPIIKDEYHTTEVIGPPKIIKFRRENSYYLKPDDPMFMTIGTAYHKNIEDANRGTIGLDIDGSEVHEVKFRYNLGEYTIVGTMDVRRKSQRLIQDYKLLGAWKTRQLLDKAKKGTIIYNEYGLQLNGYRQWGFPSAETLRLRCTVRDWNTPNSKRYKLPDKRMWINVPISDVNMDNLARTNIEESLSKYPRECTDEETWGGMRCSRFCPNYTCLHYGGPEYDPLEAT